MNLSFDQIKITDMLGENLRVYRRMDVILITSTMNYVSFLRFIRLAGILLVRRILLLSCWRFLLLVYLLVLNEETVVKPFRICVRQGGKGKLNT